MKALLAALVALLASTVLAGNNRLRASNSQGHLGLAVSQGAGASLDEVISVLSTMLQEFATQATEDKDNWEEYSKFSDESEVEKNGFINDQKALIMSSTAKENANKQNVQTLTEDLSKLAADMAETQSSLQELAGMRREERAQFEAALQDLTKTITAVDKASQILQGHYAANGAALQEIRARVQMALTATGIQTSLATQQNVEKLSSLLQNAASGREPDYLSVDGSKYNSYESQAGGGGVMGMLSDLRSQLESQRQDLIAKENEAQRAYEETKAAKEADLAKDREVGAQKTAAKANAEAIIAECQATVDQATKDVADAESFLTILLADRAKYQKMFGERTAIRKQEEAATQAALDALQSVSVGAKAGVGASSAFLQQKSITARKAGRFAMTSSAGARVSKEIVKLIQLGKELHSDALVRMASHLKEDYFGAQQQSFYDQGSFGPVIKLLNDLIMRLEEEMNAETSQHEWCENEKAGGVAAQQEREKNIHALKGTIESLTTEIAQLKTEVLFLESEIARVEEETRVAKEIRAEENRVFLQAKKDHEEVISAIGQALKALSGQYSLVQIKASSKQSPFAEYKSGAGGAGSALEMLEDLQNRYSTALHELIATEESTQKAHDDLLARNTQFLAECVASKNAKISQRRRQIVMLGEDKADMKTNLVELHDVSKYLQDLRPSCDDIRSTYEERKKRREAEIAALKEALEVLSDPSMMG